MTTGYFPGCSLEGMAGELDLSLRAVAGALGLALAELDDWACCGASSAHATNRLMGVCLPARTLALAHEQGHDSILAPCAACYSRLASARHALVADGQLAARVAAILQRPVATPRVMNVVDYLAGQVELVEGRAKRRLEGLSLACYYGCLLTRPAEVTGADADAPESMERVVRATGARAVDWPMRLECCGAGLSLARTGSVIRLGRAVVESARRSGAHAIVVACPMCHSNLDFRQSAMGGCAIPVLYLTQVVGLALGLEPAGLGLETHFVRTGPVVARVAAGGGSR